MLYKLHVMFGVMDSRYWRFFFPRTPSSGRKIDSDLRLWEFEIPMFAFEAQKCFKLLKEANIEYEIIWVNKLVH